MIFGGCSLTLNTQIIMAFVCYVDDALVLALSSLRMNNNNFNNEDDYNNYNNYKNNKISIGTDNRNFGCMTYSYSSNLHNDSLPSLSAKSQHDYEMNIADNNHDDSDKDSVPSLKSLVFDKKRFIIKFS